jgi:hypothetical protein
MSRRLVAGAERPFSASHGPCDAMLTSRNFVASHSDRNR